MEKEPVKHPASGRTATDEEIKSLVAQTLLAEAIKRHMAKEAAANAIPETKSTDKKPPE